FGERRDEGGEARREGRRGEAAVAVEGGAAGHAVAAGVLGQGVRDEWERVHLVRRCEDRHAALQGAGEGGILGVPGGRRRQGVLPERDRGDDRDRREGRD